MTFLVCACYFSKNIFVQQYKLHVTYHTEEKFIEDYKRELHSRGCVTDTLMQEVIQQVKDEVTRRRHGGAGHVERCLKIRENYQRLHPHIYELSTYFLEQDFLELVRYARSSNSKPEDLVEMFSEEEAPMTFSFPVFTPDFCHKLLEELQNFEKTDLPKGRPNTMNRGGVLLSELGMDMFMDDLRTNYLMPLARLLYPDLVGEGLDSHRAFVVKYAMGQDVELSYHYDNAEVTLNVCLTSSFSGGQLYFGPMRQERSHRRSYDYYQHFLGKGLIHRGQHMHGACPITEGDRYNLIVWMRASSIRNRLCPMCDKPPDLVPNLGYGDGFTEQSTL